MREGDRLEANTFRKVQKDTGTGSESERVKLRLMVSVEGVEYDAEGGCAAERCAAERCAAGGAQSTAMLCCGSQQIRIERRCPAAPTCRCSLTVAPSALLSSSHNV